MLFARTAVLLPALLVAVQAAGQAAPQVSMRYKSAVVALVDDAQLRAKFESRLVQKAIANNYDAVTTFDIEPDVAALDEPEFIELLRAQGIHFVLMMRPAAIGRGSSIEAVRDQVSPSVFALMSEFAAAISPSGPDDLLAVVHLAIYAIDDDATLISAGAVWLDQDVADQDEGIERLQNLIVYNVNAVRPAIRRHFGMLPLETYRQL